MIQSLHSIGTFVLIDDARDATASGLIFHQPLEVFEASTLDQVVPILERMREVLAAGYYLAGYIAYEAGAALNPKIPSHLSDDRLLWFGAFKPPIVLSSAAIRKLLPDSDAVWLGPLQPRLSAAEHQRRIARAKTLIEAGDIYQANLTFMADMAFVGDPLALYGRLRMQQRTGHSALVSTGDETILSLSPEQFFAVEGDRVTCRPMKGTLSLSEGGDVRKASEQLAGDPKQLAENLMIVDLMRNDLARIAEPGSVRVPELFSVESYPTLLQLVSSIEACRRSDIDTLTVLKTLFPCGSVTGAPKVRAMQVTSEIEDGPRGIYTGAIGYVAPDGDARFNVAIRTLRHRRGADQISIGLGSGVVADSESAQEWEECLAKAQFLGAARRDLELVETMAFEPGKGLRHSDRHLARLSRSAATLGFVCNLGAIERELDLSLTGVDASKRVRLSLSQSGNASITISEMPMAVDGPVTARLMRRRTGVRDFRLTHKTSDRAIYRWPANEAEAFDYLMVDDHGFLTEGTFTNIFVERDGMLVTPPLARGLLPGVLRTLLIEAGQAIEGDLRPSDCGSGLFLGNSLRGLRPARLVR